MFIAHRINTVAEESELQEGIGIEFDIRDSGGELLVVHDPFQKGEDLEYFLSKISKRRFLVVNIKSEGIEFYVLHLLKKYELEDFCFLDSSFPMIIKLVRAGESRIALRFSEYEGIDTIKNMRGLVKWVWVDTFKLLPLTKEIEVYIHSLGYKIILVSPELHLLERVHSIQHYKDYLLKNSIHVDAICTKSYNMEKWYH